MKLNISPSLIRQYAVVVIVNLAVLTTGMSLAWPSPVLVKLRNVTETPLPAPITEEEGSWVVAGGYLFAMITNIFGGMLLDLIGRKYCLLLTSLSKLCMALLLIFANKLWIFIFSRAVMAVIDSFVFIIVPVYASEIASKDHRGALGTFLQVFSSLGIVITLSVGPFLSYINFSIVMASVIAVTTMPLLFLPDTPFYLYSKGRTGEAIKVLTQLRGTELLANQEIEEYEISKKNENKVDKIALLKNRMFLKSISLGFLLVGGAQLVGFNAVSFYLQTVLESTKTSVKPEIASVIIGVIQVLASFCTTLIMSKFGRRTILMTSLSGMFLGMLGLGTFFKISGTEGYVITGFMNYLPIISLIIVIFCYCAGIGSLLWLVIAEIFEGPSRALGVSISITSSSLFIFITTKYFAQMTLAVGPAPTYWFFSAMCVLVGILIAIFLPETKGKTFSEIQEALGGKTEKTKIADNNVKERI
ncbi:facilitated trehalose transporter Tret1-like [Vanessa atalanta]|uniref:facilitated trehalose transporter Tret1-like n=1 Tax=Vanessa atalanta TaxID=42275 RepID=UPI001FCD99FC|nr:facilitated trehalose transporter Tret1-like [Vanessa atalanta]XP_047539535.1 facilitated trehalose transporter Tret1-like [Vanessa atalanta]